MSSNELDTAERSQAKQSPPPTVLEWTVRVVSLAVLLLLGGYVVVSGLGSTAPPEFAMEVERDKIEMRSGEWVVPTRIRNIGDTSVAQLALMVVVVAADETIVASAPLDVPLLGLGGSFDAELWFLEDPRPHRLDLDIGGYTVP